MKGDKETCLAAGMDGYIAKPVTRKDIRDIIADVLSLQRQSRKTRGSASRPSTPWNPLMSLEKLEGNGILLRELIGIFLQENPKQLIQLREAIECADQRGMERTAHSLKGELNYLGLIKAAQQASEFERMGREGDFRLATERFRSFQAEIDAVTAAMHRVLQGRQSDLAHEVVSEPCE